MIDAVWMVAAGILAGSVLSASILLATNFPRIHAAQAATLAMLESLEDASRVRFEVCDAKVNQLEQRVAELERNAHD